MANWDQLINGIFLYSPCLLQFITTDFAVHAKNESSPRLHFMPHHNYFAGKLMEVLMWSWLSNSRFASWLSDCNRSKHNMPALLWE